MPRTESQRFSTEVLPCRNTSYPVFRFCMTSSLISSINSVRRMRKCSVIENLSGKASAVISSGSPIESQSGIAAMNGKHTNFGKKAIFLQLLFFHHAIGLNSKPTIRDSNCKSCIPPTAMRAIYNQGNGRISMLLVKMPRSHMFFTLHKTSVKCLAQRARKIPCEYFSP